MEYDMAFYVIGAFISFLGVWTTLLYYLIKSNKERVCQLEERHDKILRNLRNEISDLVVSIGRVEQDVSWIKEYYNGNDED